MATQGVLSLDEYFDLPEKPGHIHELVRGRLVQTPLPEFLHGKIQTRIGYVLTTLTEPFPDLEVASNTGFLLDSDTEQGPDVLVISREAREKMQVYL
ncbi:MAG: Uma2 family endonuclease [Bryobacteraceae bacterium]